MRLPHLSKALIPLLFATALGACSEGNSTEEEEEEIHETDLGFGVFRRLTRTEYNNTLRDLMGVEGEPAAAFPPDEETLGFDNNAAAQNVSPLLAENYMTASESLAEEADLGQIVPCNWQGEDAALCARQFIEEFGARAYRRPLRGEEVDKLADVFAWGLENESAESGFRMVLQAILQSPNFLYRVESGTPVEGKPEILALNSYELASRLSYMLWNTMPDAELFAAASEGRLETKEDVEEQARRMMADPKAKVTIAHFYRQWLKLKEVDELQKDPEIFQGFTPQIARLLREETERVIDYIIWDQDADIREIFATNRTFRNGELSRFYGEAGPLEDEFLPMSLDPTKRAGILSHGSILATQAKVNQSSPIHRGLFVREQLFCHIMPEPPDDIAIVPPDLDPSLSTRERFAQHREDPACAGCHAIMDPIGFGFEHFDGVGRYRADENGIPVDASGELTVTDVDGVFDGAPGLAEKLVKSEDLLNCVVSQAFRFGYGRGESENDQHTMEKLRIEFSEKSGSLQELFVAMTQTDAFMYRRKSGALAEGEGE